jgi:hypothetical protein
MSALSVDVLGAHRSRRGSVRMPSPYNLQAITTSQCSSQAGSDSGSTNTHVTAPRKLSKRASLHGIERQIHPVKRRSRSQIDAQSVSSVPTSGLTLSSAEKANLGYAMDVYVAELCNTHSWPETNLSKTMAGEAFSQGNAHARKHHRLTTDETHTASFNRRVNYVSSVPRTISNVLSAD